MKWKPTIRCRPYLLLEVLLSIALISLCAVPLLTPHFAIARKEMKAIREVSLELKARKAFEQVREKLYRNEIPWKPRDETVLGKVGDATYIITVPKQYRKGTGDLRRTYRLLNIKIVIDHKSRDFHLFAEKVKS